MTSFVNFISFVNFLSTGSRHEKSTDFAAISIWLQRLPTLNQWDIDWEIDSTEEQLQRLAGVVSEDGENVGARLLCYSLIGSNFEIPISHLTRDLTAKGQLGSGASGEIYRAIYHNPNSASKPFMLGGQFGNDSGGGEVCAVKRLKSSESSVVTPFSLPKPLLTDCFFAAAGAFLGTSAVAISEFVRIDI
jgi:hypothetical protein